MRHLANKLKYIGIPFELGVNDCFTLICEYYEKELGIKIERLSDMLSISKSEVPIIDKVKAVDKAFKEVDFNDRKENDILLFKNSGNGLHCGIYISGDRILHNLANRGSSTIEYLSQIPFRLVGVYRNETLF